MNYKRNKKIGEGWQYTVYDLGTGRVLKIFHSTLRSYWIIFKTIFPFKEDSLGDIISFSKGMKIQALLSFKVLESKKIPLEWIGMPKFINDLDFEQDKVTPLSDVLSSSTVQSGKAVIDAFILFNQKLLSFGVIDKSFNITKNFGVNATGDIILIDIGEIFDDPKKIRKQITTKAWSKSYVAGEIKNLELQKYFLDKMEKSFTIK